MRLGTRKPAEIRRREIAEAVLRVIGERGATSLTAARIAAEVGLTSGALFRHFASLDEVLEAAVQRAIEMVDLTFPDPDLAPAVRLRAVASARIELISSTPGLAWLLLSDQVYLSVPPSAVDRLRELVSRSKAFLLDALREGMADGSLRTDIEAETMLVLFQGTIHAAVGASGVHRHPASRTGRVLDALFKLLAPPSNDHTHTHTHIQTHNQTHNHTQERSETMNISTESLVGSVVTEHPLAARVFARHGIDFCCGGGRPLGEACTAHGVDAEAVLAEIDKEITVASESETRWDEEPVSALIDHIVREYHEPLREELPRLDAMARKVNDVHGDKDPERLQGIQNTVAALRADLEQHMMKEEQVLFPMIRSGQGGMAQGPISVMEMEHDEAGGALLRLRELTDGYVAPEQACNTWRALYAGLADLERSLHVHIHLENNILHRRALAS